MRGATEYKNIVFDMGGVLIRYEPDNATKQFTDDPEIIREIHNVLFGSQEWLMLDMGIISDETAIRRVLPRLSNDVVRKIAGKTFDHWHEYSCLEKKGIDGIIRETKKRGQKAYVLSNASTRLTEHYASMIPVPELFDGLLFSGETRSIKPQTIIYQHFFERFSLNPADCLFIDDLQDNVEASFACGMDGWWFSTGDVEDLKRFLEIG